MHKPITTPAAANEASGVWYDGAPLSLPSDLLLADLLAYRRLVCPDCRKRGMKARPQHNPGGRYRILACCRTCRHVEVC
jgi:hypothetical protein